MIDTIAFDGDDTLWHNESIFDMTQGRFRQLLLPYVPAEEVDRLLLETERRNLRLFGYGIKGFILSMIETAVEVTGQRVSARDIQTILDFGKAMLEHPVELIDGVVEALDRLSPGYRLLLITKGDLFDQESKIARSGLAERFERIEIVSEKDPETYRRILVRHGVPAERFVMVGNSVRSDILPVLEIGGHAVHIPYHITWGHEQVEEPGDGFRTLESAAGLPGLLEQLQVSASISR
ncbi:MAG TPA: HAD family hydrolase [Azospirillaceae bacterium]|nr:HAD family hydrolase [Azospirillaceae bacterium]